MCHDIAEPKQLQEPVYFWKIKNKCVFWCYTHVKKHMCILMLSTSKYTCVFSQHMCILTLCFSHDVIYMCYFPMMLYNCGKTHVFCFSHDVIHMCFSRKIRIHTHNVCVWIRILREKRMCITCFSRYHNIMQGVYVRQNHSFNSISLGVTSCGTILSLQLLS